VCESKHKDMCWEDVHCFCAHVDQIRTWVLKTW